MGKRICFTLTALILLAVGFLMTACGGGGGGGSDSSGIVRNYQATATAGDFIKIMLDGVNDSYSYENITTGYNEIGTYAEETDGYITFTPQGGGESNIVTAFEAPGLALIMVAKNTGEARQTTIVFGLPETDITVADLAGKTADEEYNLLQFRTGSSNGFEFGLATLAAGGTLSSVSYDFRNNAVEGIGESGTPLTADTLQRSADGKYLILNNGPDDINYIFKTPTSGVLAVDTPNGNILLLKTQTTKEFQTVWAGTYNAVHYSDNNEGAEVGRSRLTIAADGKFSIERINPGGEAEPILTNKQFSPLADAKGQLLRLNNETSDTTWAWDNKGAFYWQDPATDQEIFAVFQNGSVFFASLTVTSELEELANGLPRVNTFNYLYGAGLKGE